MDKPKNLPKLVLGVLEKSAGKSVRQLGFELNYVTSQTTIRACLQELLHDGRARYELYGRRLQLWYKI